MVKKKTRLGLIIFLTLLVIAFGVIDYLVPQLPALSISEGIFEALQAVGIAFLGVIAFMKKK